MKGATSVLLGIKGLNAGEFIIAVDLHQKGALLHDGPLLPPAVEGQLHLHAVGVDGGEHLGPAHEPVHQQTLVPNLTIGEYIQINIFVDLFEYLYSLHCLFIYIPLLFHFLFQQTLVPNLTRPLGIIFK